ncbi:DUF748 domain-containing protein [Maribacter flavus]|uniref:DUF748 domain-containing protein n=1 Tax=Maribacter flavus TaxID=1658664 RepID=A0A5B2U1C2_9FLAO|nr:DUF748 domain-containing protein [Maribacter flavus]KAA2219835.1 DUF748 domain-containing protein [Maribacter flavus]
MNFKKISIWLLGFLILSIGLYFFAEWQMKKAIAEFLERKVPSHVQYSYDQLDISLIKGNLDFENPVVNNLGRQTSSCEISANMEKIAIKGFSYWRLFLKGEIHATEILLSKPNLTFKTCPADTTTASKGNTPIHLLKPISVNTITLKDGHMEIWDSNGEKQLLNVGTLDFVIKEVATDTEKIKDYIPMEFGEYQFSFNQISGPSGEYEEFEVGSYQMDNESIEIMELEFKTKYTRRELSEKISYERDHVSLKVPEIRIEKHDLTVIDEVLELQMDTVVAYEPFLNVYRDKSLMENPKIRPLYSQLIRQLPIKLQIKGIELANGFLSYEEDAPNNVRPGVLTFENLGAHISNFSNTENEGETVDIRINANFMGNGELDLDWKFDVFDPKETFIISGGLSNMETSTLNDFLVPNARLRAQGTIDQMFFTLSGGDFMAQGDIKMNYEDFKLELLNKERSHVKKIMSFIGNLFINDGSKVDDDGYRHGTMEVERNRNKSFFNYLWVGLEDGLIDVVTGSGKRK